jgi:hypothetical protein
MQWRHRKKDTVVLRERSYWLKERKLFQRASSSVIVRGDRAVAYREGREQDFAKYGQDREIGRADTGRGFVLEVVFSQPSG